MAFLSRKTVKIAMFIGVPLAVAAGILSGLLLTGTGRNMLADAAESMTSGPDFGLEIGTIGGSSLGDLKVDSITVRDGKGVWFTASDITLNWHPTALLKGNVAVEKLTAAQMSLARLPDAKAETPSDDSLRGRFRRGHRRIRHRPHRHRRTGDRRRGIAFRPRRPAPG